MQYFSSDAIMKSAIDKSNMKDKTEPSPMDDDEESSRLLLSKEDTTSNDIIKETSKSEDVETQENDDARPSQTSTGLQRKQDATNPAGLAPGAVRVGGMMPRDGSQLAFSSDDGFDRSVAEQVSIEPVHAEVVAEVVRQGEGRLIQEFLRFVRGESVVPAEQVVSATSPRTASAQVEEFDYSETVAETEPNASKAGRRLSTSSEPTQDSKQIRRRRLILGVAVLCVIIIAVILIALLVSRSKNKSSPAHAPTSSPTAKPISRLDEFRSFLLNEGVSNDQDLSDPSSPQYEALTWLAYQDHANLTLSTSSNDTIVKRFVTAALYFADGGAHWNQNNSFLSPTPTCKWNDGNGNGVLCNPLQIELGKHNVYTYPLSHVFVSNKTKPCFMKISQPSTT